MPNGGQIKRLPIIHIGFDDIDSPRGGCTTHFVAELLVKWIKNRGINLIDYPNLVRLNPGVPWKTRGNGALVLRLDVRDEDMAEDLFEEAIVEAEKYVSKYKHPESQPSLAMFIGEIPGILEFFAGKAVNDIVPITFLERIIDKIKPRVKTSILSKGKRGLVGSLAGIGYRMLNTDYTFELIAYRSPEYYGRERLVDPESVKIMDKETKPHTILNFDYEIDKPLIIPHGPDPVLYGIRGEDPDVLVRAKGFVKTEEPVTLEVIFRTNQHTDAHLRETVVRKAFPYRGVIVRGIVSRKPSRIMGGHVIFSIRDDTGEIDVAAYEPTGSLRNIVEKLLPGDEVVVYGVVRPPGPRHGATINLEKIRVVAVKPQIVVENPICPRCGKRMKSMGRGKGFKCPRCGYRDPNARKITRYLPRDLEPGFYEPPPRSFKHLMKPIQRFGREKKYFPAVYSPRRFIWVNGNLLR